MKIHMDSGDRTVEVSRPPRLISVCRRYLDQPEQVPFITTDAGAVTCQQCLVRMKKAVKAAPKRA